MAVDSALLAIHELGSRWADRAFDAEQEGRIASDTADELQSLEVHRFLQPMVHGGRQDSIHSHMRLVAAIGEYDVATSWCAAVWSIHNWMVALFPDEGQKEVWADPSALTSASIVPRAAFETDGGDVSVHGRFSFASGCDHAGWLGVGGMATFQTAGTEQITPVICLLPAAEAAIDHDSWHVVGLSGTGSKDIVIEQPLRIPAHRVLRVADAITRSAPGQLADDRVLYRAPYRPTAILVLAAPAIGAARAAVRRFRERLDGHQLFMVQSSQRSDPAAGARLAESSADTNAAELVLLDAARRLDEMAATPQEQLDPVDVATIHRDAAYGVRLCARAVDRLYEASGGSSLQRDEPMQRIWRDVHAARSHAILTWDAAATNYAAAVLG